jgi:hypothetical protein
MTDDKGWRGDGPARKAVVGFAHRFRPTYPGFPVEVGGVEQLHAAFFERKPHTRSWLVLRVGNPGNAGANVGHPCGAVATATGLRGRVAVSHIPDVGHPALVAGMEPRSAGLSLFGRLRLDPLALGCGDGHTSARAIRRCAARPAGRRSLRFQSVPLLLPQAGIRPHPLRW